MPTRLLGRCQPDSILEFRLAARERLADGRAAAAAGRRTAAVYLFGYAAEMTLKAGYFNAIGFPPAQVITAGNLRGAAASAPSFGFLWTGNLHSLSSWSELLVRTRGRTPGLSYPDPRFGDAVLRQVRPLEGTWAETLRYHRNVAYAHEVDLLEQAAGWLLANARLL